jgi:hypothetical protein
MTCPSAATIARSGTLRLVPRPGARALVEPAKARPFGKPRAGAAGHEVAEALARALAAAP